MKTTCMALLFAALVSPAAAEEPDRSATAQTRVETSQHADERSASARKAAQPAEDDIIGRLGLCGARWNEKLEAYEAQLPKLEKYLAYYRAWENYPAQRPPKPTARLTRATYRACMHACLGDSSAVCPGGWPVESTGAAAR